MVSVYFTSVTEMNELLAGRVTPNNVYRRVGRQIIGIESTKISEQDYKI